MAKTSKEWQEEYIKNYDLAGGMQTDSVPYQNATQIAQQMQSWTPSASQWDSDVSNLGRAALDYQPTKTQSYYDNLSNANNKIAQWGNISSDYTNTVADYANQLQQFQYTPDRYAENIANVNNMLNNFTPYDGSDGALAREYLQQYLNADPMTFSQQDWQDEVNAAIRGYGTYGDPYKSMYDTQLNDIINYSDYTSTYQPQMDQIVSDLLNRGSFSYDLESDPKWEIYKEWYQRNGEKAMKDTLGQMAARTGGLASSYAGSAAQQQYNSYMQDLNMIIPQLEQIAYERWLGESGEMRNNLSALMGLDQSQYRNWQGNLDKRYQNLNAIQGARDFDYGVWADARNDLYNQAGILDNLYNREYNAYTDDLNKLAYASQQYGNWDTENYNRSQQELQNIYQMGDWYRSLQSDDRNYDQQRLANTLSTLDTFSGLEQNDLANQRRLRDDDLQAATYWQDMINTENNWNDSEYANLIQRLSAAMDLQNSDYSRQLESYGRMQDAFNNWGTLQNLASGLTGEEYSRLVSQAGLAGDAWKESFDQELALQQLAEALAGGSGGSGGGSGSSGGSSKSSSASTAATTDNYQPTIFESPNGSLWEANGRTGEVTKIYDSPVKPSSTTSNSVVTGQAATQRKKNIRQTK